MISYIALHKIIESLIRRLQGGLGVWHVWSNGDAKPEPVDHQLRRGMLVSRRQRNASGSSGVAIH